MGFDYNWSEGFCPVEHYRHQMSGQALSGAFKSIWDCGWGWHAPYGKGHKRSWQKPWGSNCVSDGFRVDTPEEAIEMLGKHYKIHQSSLAYCVEAGMDVDPAYAAFFGVDVNEVKRHVLSIEAQEEAMFGP
jgi:hypothetical protein